MTIFTCFLTNIILQPEIVSKHGRNVVSDLAEPVLGIKQAGMPSPPQEYYYQRDLIL